MPAFRPPDVLLPGEHFPHQCLRGLRGKTPDRDSINKAIEAAAAARSTFPPALI
jgi:hypothetical protein